MEKIKNKICKNCNYKNKEYNKYCQQCGNHLQGDKFSFQKLVSSFDFGNVAGAGMKGTSIAPLTSLGQKERKLAGKPNQEVIKRLILEDGKWFCPQCGQKNIQYDFQCTNCGSVYK